MAACVIVIPGIGGHLMGRLSLLLASDVGRFLVGAIDSSRLDGLLGKALNLFDGNGYECRTIIRWVADRAAAGGRFDWPAMAAFVRTAAGSPACWARSLYFWSRLLRDREAFVLKPSAEIEAFFDFTPFEEGMAATFGGCHRAPGQA